MKEIIVRRVEESKYELDIDGTVVETYRQTEMEHPWDWADDAKNNGVSDAQIERREYEYVDAR